ncbi:MAG TPA: hypothetical protein VN114_04915, partial [Oxalicibacterium sp.]|uniref:hypothetical protein n=1 Tax=Oxalicibacterium sp. TaxID=2766525 RepID=UPI002B54A514
ANGAVCSRVQAGKYCEFKYVAYQMQDNWQREKQTTILNIEGRSFASRREALKTFICQVMTRK